MNARVSAIAPLVAMMLLGALSLWLERAVQITVNSTAKLRHDPDFSVNNFSVRRFDVTRHTAKYLFGGLHAALSR